MGLKVGQIKEGSKIILYIGKGNKKMIMDATIQKILKDNIVMISVNYDKRLSFENVQVDMEYYSEDGMPNLFRNVKIVLYKSGYVMQASGEGVKHNRRDHNRVGVSVFAHFRKPGHGLKQIMLRDISISGFSITDRSKDLGLKKGEKISVQFNDLGYSFDLQGRVVRIEDQPNATVYGLEICNLCNGLASYLNVKQGQKQTVKTTRANAKTKKK